MGKTFSNMGQFFLILSWGIALGLMLVTLLGQLLQSPWILGLTRPLASVQIITIWTSFILLILAFIQHDFHCIYVAGHSSKDLPFLYRITAAWGGHEGSLLLWVSLMNLYSIIFLCRYERMSLKLFHMTWLMLSLINLGLLSLLVWTSNPFETSELLLVGQDLNPLLQDPGLVSHPPMLYLGYVGYASLYAYTMAALLSGELNHTWLQESRKLSQMAWAFLTIGITLGSWWAYRELGWGGYWFWDPVENAALMPWLAGSALLHVLRLVQKTNAYKNWSLILIITAFSLSIFGTFLVRSGITVSVHAFAHDPMRGSVLLSLFALILSGSFLLMIFKPLPHQKPVLLSWGTHSQFFLISSLFFAVLLCSVMLGTLYPVVLSTFQGGDISVGPPYYEMIFIPIGDLMLLSMGCIGLHAVKKKTLKKLLMSVCIFILVGHALYQGLVLFKTPALWVHIFNCIQQFWLVSLGLFFCFWTLLRTLQYGIAQYRSVGLKYLSIGMLVSHLGVCVLGLGLIFSSAWGTEDQVVMHTGEQATLHDYTWTLKETYGVIGPNYRGVGAVVGVRQVGSTEEIILHPEKRIYTVSHQIMTDADIDPGLWRDIFVSLGEPQDAETWSIRLAIKPLIRWIWIGGLMIALGGILEWMSSRFWGKRE